MFMNSEVSRSEGEGDSGSAAMSDLDDRSPSQRVLQAAEVLGQSGLLTYEALRDRLRISKTATWRLVTGMRDAGWVCVRHGGHLIELDHRLHGLFASAHYADPEFASFAATMSAFAARHPVHLDLLVVTPSGQLHLHESTRRVTSATPTCEATDSDLLFVACGAMTDRALAAFLDRVQTTLDPDTMRRLRSLRSRRGREEFLGYVWGPSDRYLAVSVRGNSGTAAVLRIPSVNRRPSKRDFAAVFDAMQAEVRDQVEPRRVCRRLRLLSRMEHHEQDDEQVLP